MNVKHNDILGSGPASSAALAYALRIAGIVFIVEILIMLFLVVIPITNEVLRVFFDGAALTLILTPAFHRFIYSPIIREIDRRTKLQDELEDAHIKLKSFATHLQGRYNCTVDELQDLDARHSAILENLNDIVVVCDSKMNIVFWNKKAEQTFGHSLENVLGKSVTLILPDPYRIDHQEGLKQFTQRGKLEYDRIHDAKALKKDGSLLPVDISLSAYKAGGDTFLAAIINDITDRKEADKKIHETLDRLRGAVSITIRAMVSAVEARDPYTAGHQIRSADIARALATEIGLSQDMIDSIRLAASIHDIGKISIPAEILSNPTKLSEIEYLLIKDHARKGYEILKNVESPWPLAEIVHQHHERLDGSGYPRNLKGDEIMIEARILGVADVVEAMASHRPYRPGLGIDAALDEIERNKGVFYDRTVADACLRLFREKGFKLKEALEI